MVGIVRRPRPRGLGKRPEGRARGPVLGGAAVDWSVCGRDAEVGTLRRAGIMANDLRRGPAGMAVHWVPAVLLVFAGALALGPWSFVAPYSGAVPVPEWATDSTPVRQPRLEPRYAQGVFTYRCSDCHRIIPSPLETDRTLTQHREIHLEHGINTRCFNCHHRTNRDAFVDDYGGEIPWNEPQLLCAKCHGPVYRDWQHGSHGRTNGYWDPRQGPQRRLRCIQCHDPHCPPFAPMVPAPGPNTLRMGPQDFAPHAEGHDPLRVSKGAPGLRVPLLAQCQEVVSWGKSVAAAGKQWHTAATEGRE